MVDYQTISILFAGLSIAVSIVYYAGVLRNANKTQQLQLETRKTQLFMQIYERLNSEESLKSWAELVNQEINDYDEFLMKYDSSVNPAHYAKRVHHWYTYHAIGELLRMGAIEPELVHRLQLAPLVILMWEKWEHIIKEMRLRENAPDYSEGFEYLYYELKRIRDKKGYSDWNYPQQTIP